MDTIVDQASLIASRTILLLAKMPWHTGKGIRGQIERSSFSVPSNLAEGIGREVGMADKSRKSKLHFFRIALGSLRECVTQLGILKVINESFSLEVSDLIEQFIPLEIAICAMLGADPQEWARPKGHLWWAGKLQPCGSRHIILVDRSGNLLLSFCSSCQTMTKNFIGHPHRMNSMFLKELDETKSITEAITVALKYYANRIPEEECPA